MVLEVVLVVLEVVVQLLLPQLLLLQLLPQLCVLFRKVSGIIIRVNQCWNFGLLVPVTLGSLRYQTKTHESYHLCAPFGHKISSN